MFAAKYRLNNLIAIVDRNDIQIDGNTEDIMPLEPLPEKWRSFNWHVIEVGGHDFRALNEAVGEAQAVSDRPTVIIARTIPGKGVSFAERDYHWHGDPLGKKDVAGDPPKEEQVKVALAELQAERLKLTS